MFGLCIIGELHCRTKIRVITLSNSSLLTIKMQPQQELIDRNLKHTKNDLMYRNYSRKTIESYLFCLERYLRFKKTDLDRLNTANIKYFLFTLQRKGLAPETVNLHLNAIKFFYKQVKNCKPELNIKLARGNRKLPVVLTKTEVPRLLSATKNSKHKLLLSLAYGAGLRVNEALNLKVRDIDLEELTVLVKPGKGNKERITVFPEKLKDPVRNLIAGKSSESYVFESERGGRLTARSAQKVFEKALKESGIKKEASFHSLRHSFATHLLESGVDIRYIQALLGHKNIRTTQRYTQVTNPAIKKIKSPL